MISVLGHVLFLICISYVDKSLFLTAMGENDPYSKEVAFKVALSLPSGPGGKVKKRHLLGKMERGKADTPQSQS